jgi:RHS repeat-associated protein
VTTLIACGTNLFVGGEFTAAGGYTNIHGIAIWDGMEWRTMNGGPGAPQGGIDGPHFDTAPFHVFTIAPRGNRVFVGGEFTNVFSGANSMTADNIAMATWNESDQTWTWSDLDEGVVGETASYVLSSAIINGASPDSYDLYITGVFDKAGSAGLPTGLNEFEDGGVARWRVGYPQPPSVPKVTITSPSSPSIYTNPASICLIGLAVSGYTNYINGADFYRNGVEVGTPQTICSNNTNAFVFTNVWSNASPGLHLITAVATNDSPLVGQSAPVVINIKGTNNPITARDDQYIIPVGTLGTNLQVLANDSPASSLKISQVTILHSDLGTVTISFDRSYLIYTPYPNVYGTDIFFYTVTNSSGSNDSASVTLNILAPPQVSIIAPTDKETISTAAMPLSITGQASATGSGNSIADINLFIYSSNAFTSVDQSASNGPFSNYWTNTTPGWYTFVAVATDTNGSTATSAPVTISLTNSSSSGDLITAVIANLNPGSTDEGNFLVPVDAVVTNGIFDLQGQASDTNTTSPVSYQVLLYKPSPGIADISDDVAGNYASSPPFANVTPGQTNYLGLHNGGDSNGDLGLINLTGIPNGVYEMVLQVRGGTGVTNTLAEFQLNSQLKIGQFSFSEQDLILPVSGIPITITRTYNSMNPVNADFGYNWTFAINSMNVQLDDQRQTVTLGGPQAPDGADIPYDNTLPPTISVRVGGGWDVTITLPNGQTVMFQCTFNTTGYGFSTPSWSAPGISRYTLADVNPDVYSGLLGNLAGGWNRTEGLAFNNFDIPGWILTDNTTGVQYNITRGQGLTNSFDPGTGIYIQAQIYGPPMLTSIVQPSGDTIGISSNGIVHYPPPYGNTNVSRAISIARDGSGRIIAVYDPNSTNSGLPAVQYVYNQTTSNLIQVLKLVNTNSGAYTTNFYDYNNPNFPHYITSIENGDGVTVTRNFYDSTGRLIEVEDANGNFTQFIHNITNNTEVVVDPLGNSNAYLYDGNGNVLAQTNALGQITTMAYDANNNKISQVTYLGNQPYATTGSIYDQNLNLPLFSTNPLGYVNAFTYVGYNLSTSTDARNNTMTNYYDSLGNLTGTSDALGDLTTNSYSGGMLVSSTDAPGTTTTNSYDTSQNLIAMATLSSNGTILNTNSFAYDLNGNRLTSTVWRHSNGSWVPATTTNVYDAQNRVIQTIDPDGGTNSVVYDGAGKQIATIDKLGHTNTYVYDFMGRLVQTIYPDMTTETSVYDANGNRTNSVDRAGNPTSYFYDALNRLTNTVYADSSTSSTIYDGVGRVFQTIDGLGTVTRFNYDVAGQRVAVTNAVGTSVQATTFYSYDPNGNQTNFVDAWGRTTTNVFDALNRQFQALFPDGTQTGTAYDGDGRKVAQTNQDAVVTLFGYDGAGRLTSVTNAYMKAEQIVTSYQYDEAGNEINQIDALNRTNVYVYDGLGRRVQHVMPGGQSEGFTYDLDGNLIYQTNFNNVIITNQYDVMNRLINKASVGGYNVSFAYSPTGQRTNMIDASGTTTNSYDNRDRLLLKAVNWSGGPTVSLNYGYDSNGNVISISSSTTNGVNMAYSYDPLSRLTNVLTSNGLSASYDYDLTGNLIAVSYGNGVTNLYQYDSLNRLTNAVWNSGSSPLASFYYQLGLAGNRTNLNETNNGVNLAYTWKYDALYRLTNEYISGLGAAGYGYDPVGNRTNRASTISLLASQTNTFNTNDWLTTDAYDNNGNTLSSTNNGGTTGPCQYDVMNHLTNFNGILMVYNGDGLRTSEVVAGATNYYLLDDRNPTGYTQVVEQWSGSSGNPPLFSGAYYYGTSLFSQRVSSSGGKNYFISDGHGSTRLLVGIGGAVNNAFTYDAYGNLIASNGPSQTLFLYCGEPYDINTGLYLNLGRYLNASTGRFLTRDTSEGDQEEPLSLHKYLYCAANPVNLTDPSGNGWAAANLGTQIHNLIAENFEEKVAGGISGPGVRSILLKFVPNNTVGDTLFRLFPDLVDVPGKQVYEIKPDTSFLWGVAQLNGYIQLFNYFDPSKGWKPGATYVPPFEVTINALTYAVVSPPVQGVILYHVFNVQQIAKQLTKDVGKSFGADMEATEGIATLDSELDAP